MDRNEGKTINFLGKSERSPLKFSYVRQEILKVMIA